jgi:selenophosphate synthase
MRQLHYDRVPKIANVEKMAVLGAISGSSRSNEAFAADHADFTTLNAVQRSIVCDAQTSGGLLISIPRNQASELLEELTANGINAALIGEVTNEGEGKITIGFSR